MVTTFFTMLRDDPTIAASIRPEAATAQVAAEKAQKLAEHAQTAALVAQAAASSAQQVATTAQGVVDKFVEEACAADLRLERASKAVQEADGKLIEHAKK